MLLRSLGLDPSLTTLFFALIPRDLEGAIAMIHPGPACLRWVTGSGMMYLPLW